MTIVPELEEALDAFNRGDLDRAQLTAERALQNSPSTQWNHLLGLVHCRRGDPGRGVNHLRLAAEAEPGNIPYQVMLARALIDAGRPDEVLAMPEPPPIKSTGDLALWQARGEAAGAAGNADAAVAAWSRVTTAAPSDWRGWGNFGAALALQKRWPEAAEAFAEAARLNPAESKIRADAVAALVEAGRHHQRILRFEEAEAAFRRAYQLDPGCRETVFQLGLVLERTNRLDDLAKLLDDAIAAGVAKEDLSYLWALRAWREGRLEEARDLLTTTNPAEEPVVWTLMIKVADVLGDSDAAFAAALAMNAAAVGRAIEAGDPQDWKRKTQAYRDQQHQLARTITPEWASKLPVLAEPPRQKVSFLVGFPRSGTTLLDTFLLGHSDVDVLEEKQLVGAAAQVTGSIENLPDVTIQLLQRARQTYFERLSEHIDPDFDGLVIDKFPLDIGAAPLIHAMFPGAPIIFAQRHPCDVVLSAFLQPFGVVNFSDIEAAADYYDAMMSTWEASRQALPLNVHTVVYEDLVRDPESTLRAAVSFLGLEWDDRILDHRRTARERGTIITPSYDQVTQPLTTRTSGRWKRYRKQLEPVLPILLPWAERLGYSD